MSMILMAQAMKTKVGNPLRKLVLIKLADNANDDGECWPSYQHIADQCEISRSSAMRQINALCKAGLLIKEWRKGPKGNSSNVYHLNLDGGVRETPPSVTVTPPPSVRETPPSVTVTPPPSVRETPPSVTVTPGGGVTVTPRTYHSSEPINEPYTSSADDALADAFDVFWQAGMRRVGKKAARSAFRAQAKKHKDGCEAFAELLARDVHDRLHAKQLGFDSMHPTTYLNGERWNDEIIQGASEGRRLSPVEEVERAIAERDAREAASRLGMAQDGGDVRGSVDSGAWDGATYDLGEGDWQAGTPGGERDYG